MGSVWHIQCSGKNKIDTTRLDCRIMRLLLNCFPAVVDDLDVSSRAHESFDELVLFH